MSFYGYELVKATGKPTKRRFTSGRVLREIYEHLTTEDMSDANRRAKILKVYNGYLPYQREALERQGIKNITNVNFLGLRGIIEARATNILRLAQDTAPLVELQPLSAEEAGPDADKISRVVADEFSRLLRTSGRFIPALAMMNKEADLYGIGPVTWATSDDYLPLALNRGQIRFIGTGGIVSSEHDLFMFETTLPAHYLFMLLDNPEVATELGWDVGAVQRLVVNALYYNYDTHNQADNETSTTPAEEIISQMRRNGMFETKQFEEVKVINAYVRETAAPRKITHYVVPGRVVNEEDDNDFLFIKPEAYDHMDQCFLWFPYAVTEKFAKEVRGLATYLVPIDSVRNRVYCALCDATIRSSSFILNRKVPGKASDLSVVESGPYTVIDADLTPVQQQVAPKIQDVQMMAKALTDLGTSVTTGMNELPIVRDDKLYSPSSRQTKAMVQQQEDTRARHEEALFVQRMAVLDKLFQECFRRFINLIRDRKKNSDAYPEIEKFIKRCELRGVPYKTIIKAVDMFEICTCRDLVLGSEGKAGFLSEFLQVLGGSLDEAGRRSAVRDIVSLRLGNRSAERYTPADNRDQIPSDSASFATQENNAMNNGLPALVGSNQLHWSHIPVHVQVLDDISKQTQAQQVEDPRKALQVLELASKHIQEHLAFGEQEIGMEGQANEVKAMLRGLVNTTKALNLLVSRQEGVEQAQREKEERERAELERKAEENELNAAKYKADKEAEISMYREDKLHEARMRGLELRGVEADRKGQISSQRAAVEAQIAEDRAATQNKIAEARANSAAMNDRLQQRSRIAGSYPVQPSDLAADFSDQTTSDPTSENFLGGGGPGLLI